MGDIDRRTLFKRLSTFTAIAVASSVRLPAQGNEGDEGCAVYQDDGSYSKDEACRTLQEDGSYKSDEDCGLFFPGGGYHSDSDCAAKVPGGGYQADNDCGQKAPGSGNQLWRDSSCGKKDPSGYEYDDQYPQ